MSNEHNREINTESKPDIKDLSILSREQLAKKIKTNHQGSVPIILIPHGFEMKHTKVILGRDKMMFFLGRWIYKNTGEIVYFAVDGAIIKHHEKIGYLYDRSASSDGYLKLHVYKESPFG